MKRLGPWLVATIVAIGCFAWWSSRKGDPPRLAPAAPLTAADAAADSTADSTAPSIAPAADRATDPAPTSSDAIVADVIGTGSLRIEGQVVFAADGRPAAFARVRAFDRFPALTPRSMRGGADGVESEPTTHRHSGQAVHDLAERDASNFARNEDFDDATDDAERTPKPPAEALAETTADATGAFVLAGLTRGTVHVDAIAEFASCEQPQVISLTDESTVDSIRLLLTDGAALRGRVADPSGAPVAGARVVATPPFDPFAMFAAGGMQMREPWIALTDASGRFALPGLAAGLTLDLTATATGFAPSAHQKVVTALRQTVQADLILQKSGRIDVIVHDSSGQPLTNVACTLGAAELKLDELATSAESFRGTRRQLDPQGRATFEGLAVGKWQIRIDRAPWLEAKRAVELRETGETATVEFVVELGKELQGRVAARDGTPLAGARVTAVEPPSIMNVMRAARGSGRRQATTDADGRFLLLGLGAGQFDVTARAIGYDEATVSAAAGGPPIEIVLPTRGAFEGIVISQQSGKPLHEFTLHLERKSTGGGGMFDVADMQRTVPLSLAFAHEQGKFRVAGVAPGELRIAITAAGHGRWQGAWFTLADGTTRKGIIATLGPEAVIEGIVVAAADGAPIAGAQLRLVAADQAMMQKLIAGMLGDTAATSGADGRFRIGELGAGSHKLAVKKDRFVETEPPAITLAEGETSALLRIELASGAEIFGNVVDADGHPLAGASLMCQDIARMAIRSAKSDAAGNYRFEGLAPGNFALTRMPAEMAIGSDKFFEQMQGQIETRTIKLSAGESLRVDFGAQIKGSAVLVGRVVSGGAPVPDALVQVIASEQGGKVGSVGGGVAMGTCDHDGRFRVERLHAGRAFAQVNLGDPGGGGMNAVLVPVLLEAGATTEVTLEVPAASVSGEVLEVGSRKPLAGIAVYVGAAPDAPTAGIEMAMRRSLAVRTDANGKFRLDHVRPGRCRVVAGAGDLLGGGSSDYGVGSSPIVVPAVGAVDAGTLLLAPAARISGQLVDGTGKPLAQGSIFLRDAATGGYLEEWSSTSSDENGEFEYAGVPEGSWDVVARAPGYATAVARGISARPGGINRTRIKLVGGTEVFALLNAVPFADLLTLSAAVDGPDGAIPLTLFGLSELADAMQQPWQPDVVRLGRFGPGRYRVHGQLRGTPFEQTFELAGEPELRIPIRFD
ncbi:MAG: hypothetical protein EXS13_02925 [Planctomycetes bacterium]|nr:hypothetical protein [Planctomycetota bacterium]